ncbi:MAG: PilX N-terminal domain-containing pilus assembly protein [candidate division NC10 bacterium]
MKQSIQPLKNQTGFALVVALFVITILAILAIGFLTTALNEDIFATNFRNKNQAFYAAEAGLESGLVSLRTLLSTTGIPTDAQLGALAPPALNNADYTFNTFQVARVRTNPPYDYQTVINSGPYTGLNGITTDYRITAVVTGPRGNQAQLRQVVKNMQIPLFQFGAFYGEGVDFEVYAGPTFTFTGRVHANSDMYVSDSGSNGMFFDSYVTSAGNFYRRRKDQACCERAGNPDVKDGGGAYQSLDFDREVKNISADGSTWDAGDVDYWRTEALNRFGGKVQDSAHGVEKIKPPIPDAIYDPSNPDVSSHLLIEKGAAGDSAELQEAKMYYEAGLRIEDGVATDNGGNPVDLTALGCDPSTISTKTFHDKREQADMTVTQVDVGKLKACGQAPVHGILYVSKSGAGGGVRLVNGTELPSQGLTVVSENPVYIQGDYNTVNKVPAAVLGDAITVLSNNWESFNYDTKGDIATSSRQAAETTVNAAFAMGPHAEAAPGAGNGEFNNLIRFVEDWKNVNFNYNGSVIALWHSQQATAPWRCCGDDGDNYYVPPIRNWAYDSLFDTNPPPGTPMGIIQMRGQWSAGG